jgi:uncharacterized membrane protein YpjA
MAGNICNTEGSSTWVGGGSIHPEPPTSNFQIPKNMQISWVFNGDLMDFFHPLNGIYPLVNKQFAIEHGPVEIVDLPINSMADLSIVFCMFTRG